jgi:hypothetical protein
MALEHVRCLTIEESTAKHAVMYHKGRKLKQSSILTYNFDIK